MCFRKYEICLRQLFASLFTYTTCCVHSFSVNFTLINHHFALSACSVKTAALRSICSNSITINKQHVQQNVKPEVHMYISYLLAVAAEESDVGGYTSKCAHKFHEMGLEYVACKWIRISWKTLFLYTRKLSESCIKPFIYCHSEEGKIVSFQDTTWWWLHDGIALKLSRRKLAVLSIKVILWSSPSSRLFFLLFWKCTFTSGAVAGNLLIF